VPLIERRAARILLVDGADRVLLFYADDPHADRGYWLTPGGGLDAGETLAEGAARELFEETGLRLPPPAFGSPVWREVVEFPIDGGSVRQAQEFFLVRVPSWDVVTHGLDPNEQNYLVGHRWWTIEELEQTDDRLYPAELAGLLRRLMDGATC
jgi:8-oxo-dGTP pyrophosphatase MutT (NUDIX family)